MAIGLVGGLVGRLLGSLLGVLDLNVGLMKMPWNPGLDRAEFES